MAQNDVGSLLVYDKDKAGPAGEVPKTIDACVGIVTERGEGRGVMPGAVLRPVQSSNVGLLSSFGCDCSAACCLYLDL